MRIAQGRRIEIGIGGRKRFFGSNAHVRNDQILVAFQKELLTVVHGIGVDGVQRPADANPQMIGANSVLIDQSLAARLLEAEPHLILSEDILCHDGVHTRAADARLVLD